MVCLNRGHEKFRCNTFKKPTIQGISSEGNESKRPGKVFQNL